MPLLQLVMSLTKSQFCKMIDQKPDLIQKVYCAIVQPGRKETSSAFGASVS